MYIRCLRNKALPRICNGFRKKVCSYFITIALLLGSFASYSEDEAQNLYTNYKALLYQIKIIDNESSQKSTIGSGFIINTQGLAVTNYHVVSRYIIDPENNRIEVEDVNGDISSASLINFDVINDLALIQIDLSEEQSEYIPLAEGLPLQGTSIYSLGNPHDLGMIVVPGTFNGLQKNSYYETIHFTGSVNSGMSGGPVVNEDGELVGVNVASAGNQLGFLVPLGKVLALLEGDVQLTQDNYKTHIAQQLNKNQEQLVNELLSAPWSVDALGDAMVPDSIADFITCWGDSNADDEDKQFLSVRKSCSLDQTIYLSDRIQTGHVMANFRWYESDKLNSWRFYNLINGRMDTRGHQGMAMVDDFSEYQCSHDTVENSNSVTLKSAICLKAYKEYDGLFDVFFVAATLDKEKASLIARFHLAGVTQESFERFAPVFMDSISWQ